MLDHFLRFAYVVVPKRNNYCQPPSNKECKPQPFPVGTERLEVIETLQIREVYHIKYCGRLPILYGIV